MGCQTPGAAGGTGNGAFTDAGSRPSPSREAGTAAACRAPAATPRSSAEPSGIRPREAAGAASSSALRDGARLTSTSCTAEATAASWKRLRAAPAGASRVACAAAIQLIAHVRLLVICVGAPAAATVRAVVSYQSSTTDPGAAAEGTAAVRARSAAEPHGEQHGTDADGSG